VTPKDGHNQAFLYVHGQMQLLFGTASRPNIAKSAQEGWPGRWYKGRQARYRVAPLSNNLLPTILPHVVDSLAMLGLLAVPNRSLHLSVHIQKRLIMAVLGVTTSDHLA